MNRDEQNELLSDALGDELESSQRERFEKLLASDRDFEKEVAGLREALAALRSLGAAGPAATPVGTIAAGRRRWRPATVLRYAAAILLAFGAGFVVRGSLVGREGPSGRVAKPMPPPAGDVPAPVTVGGVEIRFADAYLSHRSSSSLARSLVAIAQVTSKEVKK